MKKPTPRLRQVFEHSTHFKVIGPRGVPTIIAKNGLSEGLKTRLRKFADGGEVTPADPNEQAIDILKAAKDALFPDPSDAPESSDFESISKLPISEPTPSLQAHSSPTEAISTPQEEPAKAEISESIPAQPTASASLQEPISTNPSTPLPVVPIEPSPVAAYLRTPISNSETLAAINSSYPISALPSPTPTAVEPSPIHVAPPAPTKPAATVAPSTPIAQAAPEIVVPESISPGIALDADAIDEAFKLNPSANRADVVQAIVDEIEPGQQVSAGVQQAALTVPQGKDAVDDFNNAMVQYISSVKNEVEAKALASKEIDKANARRTVAIAEAVNKDRQTAMQLAARREDLRKKVEAGFNPSSLFGRLDLGNKVAVSLSMIVGGLASGLTGRHNVAIEAFDRAITRDLESQKTKYNSLVNEYKNILQDSEQADKLARADMLDFASFEVERITNRSKSVVAQAAGDRLASEFTMKALENREDVRRKMEESNKIKVQAKWEEEVGKADVALKQAQREKAEAEADFIRKGKPVAGRVSKPSVAPDASALDVFHSITDPREKQKYFVNAPNPQTGKVVTFIVPPRLQKDVQTEINRRVSAIQKIKDAIKIIESKPDVLKGQDLGAVQAAVGDFWTNFPEASGKSRLLPKADKDIVQNATLETGIPFLKNANLFGKTSAALKQFLRSASMGVKEAIEGYGINGYSAKDELVDAWAQSINPIVLAPKPGLRKVSP